MNREEATRFLAGEVPPAMKRLRGRLMLDELTDSLGAADAACPACGGTGWLDAGHMEDCPLCLGFRDVPTTLADWFRDRLSAMLSGRRSGSPAARPSGSGIPHTPPGADERPFLRPLKCHISLHD